MTLSSELQDQLIFYMEESARKIERAWSSLNEDQIWRRANDQSLAPANQLLHLTGNMKQWVLSGVGGAPDTRERDEEFAAQGGLNQEQIYSRFMTTYTEVLEVLKQEQEWLAPKTIQGHKTTVLGIWIHQVEHLSYHTAQLVAFAKQLLAREFDFYADWDLG